MNTKNTLCHALRQGIVLFRQGGENVSKIAELLGERIRDYRMKKGLSQEELAHRADMHTAHLGQIERGEKSPTIDSIEKIVNALGITFEELFSFETRPTENKESMVEKITACLGNMTMDEQKDVYKTVRMLLKWKKKKA